MKTNLFTHKHAAFGKNLKRKSTIQPLQRYVPPCIQTNSIVPFRFTKADSKLDLYDGSAWYNQESNPGYSEKVIQALDSYRENPDKRVLPDNVANVQKPVLKPKNLEPITCSQPNPNDHEKFFWVTKLGERVSDEDLVTKDIQIKTQGKKSRQIFKHSMRGSQELALINCNKSVLDVDGKGYILSDPCDSCEGLSSIRNDDISQNESDNLYFDKFSRKNSLKTIDFGDRNSKSFLQITNEQARLFSNHDVKDQIWQKIDGPFEAYNTSSHKNNLIYNQLPKTKSDTSIDISRVNKLWEGYDLPWNFSMFPAFKWRNCLKVNPPSVPCRKESCVPCRKESCVPCRKESCQRHKSSM